MGIVNVTPDSFSDGGRFVDHRHAVAHGMALLAAGADVVDVGGESTRPGATPVDEATELARVLPVIEALADHGRVSVDTAKPAVARAAVAAGATLINDVTSSLDPVAAECGVGWVAMHMQGEPRTMQQEPTYDDVVAEVADHLLARAERAAARGVGEVWIDPGIGFGKTFAHNWALLAALPALCERGLPVAVGTSRKMFLGPDTTADDRLEGSVTTALHAARSGAAMVRVHDVAATVAALDVAGHGRDADRPTASVGPDDRETNPWP
jgi:dihydropteroate synthase